MCVYLCLNEKVRKRKGKREGRMDGGRDGEEREVGRAERERKILTHGKEHVFQYLII